VHARLDGDGLAVRDLEVVAAWHLLPEVEFRPKVSRWEGPELGGADGAGWHFVLFVVEDYWYFVFGAHNYFVFRGVCLCPHILLPKPVRNPDSASFFFLIKKNP